MGGGGAVRGRGRVMVGHGSGAVRKARRGGRRVAEERLKERRTKQGREGCKV